MPKQHPSLNNTSTLIFALYLGLTLPLMGCVSTAPTFDIDSQSHQAKGKNERIRYIVLHYTAENDAGSLDILTNGNVSAHYLIPATNDNKIYNLVAESERAWHAGAGAFAGRTVLNDTSIGIEIVNEGIKKEHRAALKQGDYEYHPAEHYVAFTDLQIQKVAHLLQGIIKRYDIKPQHIIGHSDMAPSRKIDPGAKFPWERLHKAYGIGAWYDEFDKKVIMNQTNWDDIAITDIKTLFRAYGYAINTSDDWDKDSRNVIYAFQLHFRPQQPTGIMDLETYAILKSLNMKYIGNNSFQ